MTNDYGRMRAEIALAVSGLALATTVSILCPKCAGGNSGERSMSATRVQGGAAYCCHRASCNYGGFVRFDWEDAQGSAEQVANVKPARPYRGPAGTTLDIKYNINFAGLHPITTKYDLAAWGWGQMCEIDGWLFTCRDFNGLLLGHVTRTPDKRIKTYRARDGVDMYAVYYPRVQMAASNSAIVIVEDCISAMCCASHGFIGVALLGTHLTDSVCAAIKAQKCRTIIYLDADAEAKALAMTCWQLPNAYAVLGEKKDPKDNPELGTLLRTLAGADNGI